MTEEERKKETGQIQDPAAASDRIKKETGQIFLKMRKNNRCEVENLLELGPELRQPYNRPFFRGTQRKAQDIVKHNNICSSEVARMCGMSYISQLGSVKYTIWQPETQFCKWF